LKKETDKNEKVVAKLLKTHNERLAIVQEKLDEELEIKEKHQAEFERFKEAADEDDITRMKNHFAREMSELRRQHEIRLAELKKEYDEIAGVRATGQVRTTPRAPIQTYDPNQPMFTPAGGEGSRYGNWIYRSGKWTRAHQGMIIPGSGSVPIMARGGETILTQKQTSGLLKLLETVSDQGVSPKAKGITINQKNIIREQIDMNSAFRELGWRLLTA